MDNKIPWSRPVWGKEEIDAANKVLKSGWITQGEIVKDFEAMLADYLGVKYVVCTSSGTMSLLMVYTLFRDSFDRVFVPRYTFRATYNPALLIYNKFLIYSISCDDALVDPNLFHDTYKKMIGDDSLFVGVHLLGNVLDDSIVNSDVSMIEDCCQAFGSRYKNLNMVGNSKNTCVFSFHAAKLITTGEGGCITTNNEDHYYRLCHIREHGTSGSPFASCGLNGRMMDLNAAIGIEQLKKVYRFSNHRNNLYKIYYDELSSVDGISFLSKKNVNNDPSIIAISLNGHNIPSQLGAYLSERGIDTRGFFQPTMLFGHNKHVMSDTSCSYLEYDVIMLPFGNAITEDEVRTVCKHIKDFIKA